MMFLVLGRKSPHAGSVDVLAPIREGRVPLPPQIRIVGLYREGASPAAYEAAAIIQAPDVETAKAIIKKMFHEAGVEAELFTCSKFE